MGRVSLYLLAAIAIIYIVQLMVPAFTDEFAFDPALALSQPWRFVTCIFLHSTSDLFHIIFNGLALFMFGLILDRQVNARKYLFIFFGAGIFGGLLYYLTYLLGIIPDIPAIGASGAIYGILGALAVLLPEMRVYVYFFPLKMRQAVIFWIILEFLGTFDISSGIASAAHLGGLIFGIACGWYLMNRKGSFGASDPASQGQGVSGAGYRIAPPPADWSD